MNAAQPPITRVADKLFRGSKQWKFAGLNMDKIFGCWGTGEVPTDAQLDAYFAGLNPHSVTRVWPYAGANAIPYLLKVVKAAEKYGQYLAVNQLDGANGGGQCGSQGIDAAGNATFVQPLAKYFAKGADPAVGYPTNAIAFYECGNEVSGADKLPWYSAVSGAYHGCDPKTLVGMGSQPSYAFGGRAVYTQIAMLPWIDLLCAHEYDANTGISAWGTDTDAVAALAGKPWYMGEDGFCCGGGDTGSKAGNAAKLTAEYAAYLASPRCAGMLYWAGIVSSANDGTTSILVTNPNDAMWQALSKLRHAYQGDDAVVTTPPAPPANTDLIPAVSMTQLGTWTVDAADGQIYTDVAGSNARTTFNGTGCVIRGIKDDHHGTASVMVDNKAMPSMNLFNATRLDNQVLLTITGLAAGDHTLVITVDGKSVAPSLGNQVALESVTVTHAAPPAATTKTVLVSDITALLAAKKTYDTALAKVTG